MWSSASAVARHGASQLFTSPSRIINYKIAMAAELPTVRVAQGILRGRRTTNKFGNSYVSFQGVPYAKPPIGLLRFEPPQPPVVWDGIRDASKEGAVCPHRDWIQGLGFRGDEDCLFLNVYTSDIPSEKSTEKKPVMVWIHGGGFYIGSGNTDMYGPDYLIEADIVLVTMNYRLGALGFLSLEDSNFPGNIGLRDQVAALKWVRENIDQFGGDPNNVTIFGESAGGSCVLFHMMSPMSKGLFHKAIAQSGSAFNPWSMASSSLCARSFKLGEVLGHSTTDPKELIAFLRNATPKDLVEGSAKIITKEERRRGGVLSFNPIPETKLDQYGDIFLPGHPEDLLNDGKFHHVPFMTGVCSQEGILDLSGLIKHPPLAQIHDQDFERNVPSELDVPLEISLQISDEIRKFYFGDKKISLETLNEFANFFSDVNFTRGVDKAIRLIASKSSSPSFYYKFSFDGELGVFKKFIGASFLSGASHMDDLGYLFRVSKLDNDIKPDSIEMMMIRRMVKLWTNFAKTGNPTPVIDEDIDIKWLPYTVDKPQYLNIDHKLTMEENMFKKRLEFWDNLIKTYKK